MSAGVPAKMRARVCGTPNSSNSKTSQSIRLRCLRRNCSRMRRIRGESTSSIDQVVQLLRSSASRKNHSTRLSPPSML